MTSKRRSVAMASCLLPLAVAACWWGPPPPTTVELSMHAGETANGGAPVEVAVYELTHPRSFIGVDYFELAEHGAGALRGGATQVHEFFLMPGSRDELERELPPTVTHLGITAAFRDLDNAEWQRLVPLEVHRDNVVEVEIGPRSLSADLVED